MLIIKRHLSEVTKHIPSDGEVLSKDEEKSDVLFFAQPLTCFVALSLSTFWVYISQKYVAIQHWELPTETEDKAIDLAVSREKNFLCQQEGGVTDRVN